LEKEIFRFLKILTEIIASFDVVEKLYHE